MPTEVAIPPVAAPVAAAPSAPVAPTTVPSAPVAAPVVDAAKPAPEPGSPEFFAQEMAKVPTEEAPAAEPAKEGEAKPADAAPVVPADETPEQKAAREVGAAETPEQKAAKEAAAAEAARKAAEPPPNQVEIDLGESISPQGLLEGIDKAPDAVKQWFNDPANPLKETLTNMARRAAVADPILREIPDIETAQRLVSTGAEYDAFDTAFDSISDDKSAVGWWQTMYTAQMGKDAQGNPVPHPAFAQLERALVDANLGYIVEQARKTGNWHPRLNNLFYDALELRLDAAKKAIAAGQDTMENQSIVDSINDLQTAAPRPNTKPLELTPEQRRAQEQINRDRATIDADKARQRQGAIDTAFATVDKDVAESITDQFAPALYKAGLTDFQFNQAVIEIGNRLDAELGKHPYYKQRKTQLQANIQRDPNESNIKALKAHEMTYQNMKIGRIVKEVLREATAGPIKAQEAKQAKVAAQVEASRTEPRGTTAAAPAVAASANTLAESQRLWDADPKNAGTTMPLDFHFQRIMAVKK